MPIAEREGDIFTSHAQAICHGVNLQGVMGAGIAKTVRELYPSVYSVYRKACKDETLLPGGMLPVLTEEKSPRWILNLASQILPGANAKIDLIVKSVRRSYIWAENNERVDTIAFPRIGSAIGGLDWNEVRSILIEFARKHPEVKTELWTFKPGV